MTSGSSEAMGVFEVVVLIVAPSSSELKDGCRFLRRCLYLESESSDMSLSMFGWLCIVVFGSIE